MAFWRGTLRYDLDQRKRPSRGLCLMPSTSAYAFHWTRFPLCFYDTAKFGGLFGVFLHVFDHADDLIDAVKRIQPARSRPIWNWLIRRGWLWADCDGGVVYFRWPAGGDLFDAQHMKRKS